MCSIFTSLWIRYQHPSPKGERIVSTNPSPDTAITGASRTTKDQPAISETSGTLTAVHPFNAYTPQEQGYYFGGSYFTNLLMNSFFLYNSRIIYCLQSSISSKYDFTASDLIFVDARVYKIMSYTDNDCMSVAG